MGYKKEAEYAGIALKTLLGDNRDFVGPLLKQGQQDQALFKKIIKENNVTVRVLSRLGKDVLNNWNLHDVLYKERMRVKKNLQFLSEIKAILDKEKIEYLVIKSLDNYPDIGRDLDIFILSDRDKAVQALLARFKGTIARPVISEVLADKTNIEFNGLPKVEIHHQRLGVLGEDLLYPKIILRNKKLEDIDARPFFVPCDEDRVILAAEHRINRHFNLRICDVYNALRFTKQANFDWNYLWDTAKTLGLKDSVAFYLDYVKKVEESIVKHKDLAGFNKAIAVRKSFLRFPVLGVIAKAHSKRFCRFVKSLDFRAALRVFLVIPLLLLASAQKFLGRKSSW
ncbi:MAG: nucleotidyltransferase family protein [Candidatus Omnitrophica bacterium]|nr:nucleotidyltransferase family protein [Candidatus Omnitrophota bacterium]